MAATPTVADPSDIDIDELLASHRAAYVEGIRRFADLIERDESIPVPLDACGRIYIEIAKRSDAPTGEQLVALATQTGGRIELKPKRYVYPLGYRDTIVLSIDLDPHKVEVVVPVEFLAVEQREVTTIEHVLPEVLQQRLDALAVEW